MKLEEPLVPPIVLDVEDEAFVSFGEEIEVLIIIHPNIGWMIIMGRMKGFAPLAARPAPTLLTSSFANKLIFI